MLPTYFQTQTSIISFHFQSFNRADTLEHSTGQTKGNKEQMLPSCQNYLSQSQISFCSSDSLLHASSRASCIPLKVYCSLPKMCSSKQPHSLNSGQQRNTASSTALSWAEPKHVSDSAISGQAWQHQASTRNIHCGEKCPLSSTVTRLTDEIRFSTKRLLNGFLTQNWVTYGLSFLGGKNHGFYNEWGNSKK